MESGIPGALFNMMWRAFCELEEFDSNRSIRAFFKRESLNPFINSLPEGDSVSNRVNLVIAYASRTRRAKLNDEKWYDGQVLLLIFFIELYAFYHSKMLIPAGLEEVLKLLVENKILEVKN